MEYHITIAYGDVGIAPRIHNLTVTWRWVAIFRSRPLYPWQWNPDVYWTVAFVGPGTFWTLWEKTEIEHSVTRLPSPFPVDYTFISVPTASLRADVQTSFIWIKHSSLVYKKTRSALGKGWFREKGDIDMCKIGDTHTHTHTHTHIYIYICQFYIDWCCQLLTLCIL